MRTITLSESVWLARDNHSVPALFPRPAKPLLACYLLSLQSVSKINPTSKLFLRNPCSISSRQSNQWILNTCEERFWRFTPTTENSDDLMRNKLFICLGQPSPHELAFEDCLRRSKSKNFEEITDSTWIMDDNVALSKELVKKNSGIEYDKAIEFLLSDNSVGSFLKIMLFSGCLTLQGSKPALASTDFLNGVLSLPYFQDLGDISTGFASAFLLIFFSELGDKTFFIAALLAARNSAAVIFAGTFGALAAMTVISVALGRTFHYVDEILPFSFGGNDLPLDDIAAVLLLVYFGVSTLLDASSSDGLKAEEEQKEAELAVSEFSGNGAGIVAAASTVISTFFLVFVAEWGDKSFFSTIAIYSTLIPLLSIFLFTTRQSVASHAALAAASSPLGVIAGALAGHGVATLLAVLGGSLLGSFLSEKAIAYIGGVLFLVFAGITLAEIVN